MAGPTTTPSPTLPRHLALPGGRTLTIRAVEPGDAAGLASLYAGLAETDVYRRFFSGHPPPGSFIDDMTQVAGRGGVGLVAVLSGAQAAPGEPGAGADGAAAPVVGGADRIVAEASYEPLADGAGELGITVAEGARGWLGPYLLDVLVTEAAARGVPQLRADVLVDNRRMLAVLRGRGYAVLAHDDRPAVLRVAISTAGRVPQWPGPHDRARVLVEVPGGHWHAEEAARAAGFAVVACPGPRRGWAHCPAVTGEPCPLVAGADLVVDAVPGDTGRSLLAHHCRVHPTVPVCIDLPGEPAPPSATTGVPSLPRATDVVVVGLLQRLVAMVPGSEAADDLGAAAPDTAPSPALHPGGPKPLPGDGP